MNVEELSLAGALRIEPRVFGDDRGAFYESYRAERFAAAEIDATFVQDNHSRSVRNVLRGMHYQSSPGQAKLVYVARGAIFDVIVDIRPQSPTFGQWLGLELDDNNHHQLYVPIGFAHGFCVTSEVADVIYKVSSPYVGDTEATIAWNDPDIGIEWPVSDPILSPRDQGGESFAAFRQRMETK